MKLAVLLFALLLLLSPECFGQKPDTLAEKPDSVSIKIDSAGQQNNNIGPGAYNKCTKIKAGTYFVLLASDFKQEITKPFHMTGGDWRKAGLFALATGALMLADEPVQQFAARLRNDSRAVRNVSGHITKLGGLYENFILVGIGAYGFLFRNIKMQTTTLLATQSYLSSALLSDILKRTFGRQRPVYTDPATNEAEPVFYGPFRHPKDPQGKKIDVLSFPSGHTIAAFSAATVYAMEYKDKPLIPVIAYTAATLIGLSRITENKHWISDVFAGAAVGYLSGRLVVNNYHRYANLRIRGQKRNSLSFNLQYRTGVIMPGIVYHFG